MSDIFISYASADRERARVIADALAERGWSVWWDRVIPPGRQFDEVIEEALDAARCVVVLWSRASTSSTWVKTEAAEAMSRKALIPALIEEVKIPLEFRRLQAADLSHWEGARDDPQLEEFFESVEAALGRIASAGAGPGAEKPRAADVSPPRRASAAPTAARKRTPIYVGIAAAVVAVGLGGAWYAEHARNSGLAKEAEQLRLERESQRSAAADSGAPRRGGDARRSDDEPRAADTRQAEEDRPSPTRRTKEDRRAADARRAGDDQPASEARRAEERRDADAKRAAEPRRAAEAPTAPPVQQSRPVPLAGTANVRWRDHALGYGGTLAWNPSGAMLQVSVTDLRTGTAIGNYAVPALVVQMNPTEYVVSAQFAVPGDSTTAGPHAHVSRLLFRAQQDGSIRLIQNCPNPGECY